RSALAAGRPGGGGACGAGSARAASRRWRCRRRTGRRSASASGAGGRKSATATGTGARAAATGARGSRSGTGWRGAGTARVTATATAPRSRAWPSRTSGRVASAATTGTRRCGLARATARVRARASASASRPPTRTRARLALRTRSGRLPRRPGCCSRWRWCWRCRWQRRVRPRRRRRAVVARGAAWLLLGLGLLVFFFSSPSLLLPLSSLFSLRRICPRSAPRPPFLARLPPRPPASAPDACVLGRLALPLGGCDAWVATGPLCALPAVPRVLRRLVSADRHPRMPPRYAVGYLGVPRRAVREYTARPDLGAEACWACLVVGSEALSTKARRHTLVCYWRTRRVEEAPQLSAIQRRR
ncbi:hypothetical protein GGS23DRAFT_609375, partial [Durotheca rogersii]|uniref:uncharacterized protein n=1 Tax=Durotheca rogersii TaxID=419775 RepID=UPI00221EB780